jgi:hypothetical protein
MKDLFDQFNEFANDLNNFFPQFDVPDVQAPQSTSSSTRSGPTRAQRIASLLEFVIGHELNDFEKAIFDLAVEFRDAQREANALGVLQDRVRIARAKAIKDLIDDVFQPIEDALEALKTDTRRTNPVQSFQNLQARFDELARRARAGDIEAINQIPQAQQELLDFGQQFFGSSTEAFQALADSVQRTMEDILAGRDEILGKLFDEGTLAQIAELEKQTSLLEQIESSLAAGIAFSNQQFRADQRANASGGGGGGGAGAGSGSGGGVGGGGGGGGGGASWQISNPAFNNAGIALDQSDRSRIISIAEHLHSIGQIPNTGGVGSTNWRLTPGDLNWWIDNASNWGGGNNRGFIRNIVGRRFGGSVNPGSTFLVGESGPELLVTGTPGNVLPFNNNASLPPLRGDVEVDSEAIVAAIEEASILMLRATSDQTDVLTEVGEVIADDLSERSQASEASVFSSSDEPRKRRTRPGEFLRAM